MAQRSHREVARSLGISAGTVASVVGRVRLTGVTRAHEIFTSLAAF